MKISKAKPNFSPVTITLETKEEFNFLLGLLNGAEDTPKEKCVDFCPTIDQQMWDLMNEITPEE